MTKETEKTDSCSERFWKHIQERRPYYIAIVGFAFSVCLIILFPIPEWLITPLLYAFPALAALDLAARRIAEMNRQNNLAEQRNTADIFSRAIEQLGHVSSAVRRGGVATLRQLGESAEKEGDLRKMIIKTLVAFVSDRVGMTEREEETGEWIGREEKRGKKLDVEDAISALASITEDEEERRKVNLDRTDLRNLHFLQKINLSFFKFNNADLRKVLLGSADLRKSMLQYADVRGANLSQADLRKAALDSTDWREAVFSKADLRGASFHLADLRKAVLENSDLRGASLASADLREAKLRGARLRGVNLTMANLQYARLFHPDFREGDLTFADLRGIMLQGADLRRADLSQADLREDNLAFADLREAKLNGSNFRGVSFESADLRKADLNGSDLCGSAFRYTDLSGAVLGRANLSRADLKDIKNLTQEQLNGISYYEEFPPRNLPESLVMPDAEQNIIKPGDSDYDEEDIEWLKQFKQDESTG